MRYLLRGGEGDDEYLVGVHLDKEEVWLNCNFICSIDYWLSTEHVTIQIEKREREKEKIEVVDQEVREILVFIWGIPKTVTWGGLQICLDLFICHAFVCSKSALEMTTSSWHPASRAAFEWLLIEYILSRRQWACPGGSSSASFNLSLLLLHPHSHSALASGSLIVSLFLDFHEKF